MNLTIKIAFPSGGIGVYRGELQHKWFHIEGDSHEFTGYWPEEDLLGLQEDADHGDLHGSEDMKIYLSRMAQRHGAQIEITEEGEAMDMPDLGEGVKI